MNHAVMSEEREEPNHNWCAGCSPDNCSGCGDSDLEQAGYWCVVCGRFLRADEFGVIVHDDKPHPESMTFEEPMQ